VSAAVLDDASACVDGLRNGSGQDRKGWGVATRVSGSGERVSRPVAEVERLVAELSTDEVLSIVIDLARDEANYWTRAPLGTASKTGDLPKGAATLYSMFSRIEPRYGGEGVVLGLDEIGDSLLRPGLTRLGATGHTEIVQSRHGSDEVIEIDSGVEHAQVPEMTFPSIVHWLLAYHAICLGEEPWRR
jgi:hypothetical protein